MRIVLFLFLLAASAPFLACKGSGGSATETNSGTPEGNAPAADPLAGVAAMGLPNGLQLDPDNTQGQLQPMPAALASALGLQAPPPEAGDMVKHLVAGRWAVAGGTPAVLYAVYDGAGGGTYTLYVASPGSSGNWRSLELGKVSRVMATESSLTLEVTEDGRLNVTALTKVNNGGRTETQEVESGYGYQGGDWRLVAG